VPVHQLTFDEAMKYLKGMVVSIVCQVFACLVSLMTIS